MEKVGDARYSDYGAGGGSGGYDTNYFDVVPGTQYSLVVGAGGAYRGESSAAKSGNSGFVLIAYGGDI